MITVKLQRMTKLQRNEASDKLKLLLLAAKSKVV